MKFSLKSEYSDTNKRIDLFLTEKIPDFSRAKIQNFIKNGKLKINGITVYEPKTKLHGESFIELECEKEDSTKLTPENISLNIIFEDKYILVLNKATGMAVHPGAGLSHGTIVNALIARYDNFLEKFSDNIRPGIVHRLDMETSGCLLIAKDEKTRQLLSNQFSKHEVHKEYLGITYGHPKEKIAVIDTYFGRHPVVRNKMAVLAKSNRKAITEYKVLDEFYLDSIKCALLKIKIKTGRTHQIRVHMAYIHTPILGDKIYGGKQDINIPRQMLHSWKITFSHPYTKEKLEFECPLPEDMKRILSHSPSFRSSERNLLISD
ncbi:MAG TPA: RluA family pseudouridine synthase [Victivallales bacterium]|nr:RluA family pseudouridine synthase [Victivallales bacterium]HPO89552.1 RluA family pseudouridine synthase [Victivallales bacterium]HRU01318.1 RluA family pseudouridine synthase [Victivallales bacterium]